MIKISLLLICPLSCWDLDHKVISIDDDQDATHAGSAACHLPSRGEAPGAVVTLKSRLWGQYTNNVSEMLPLTRVQL